MPDFAWIISVDRQFALGKAGVSSSYIMPRGEVNDFEKDLPSNKIWIILRGLENRCIAAVTVKRVERFSEGFHIGDFLIYTDLTRSIRLCSYYDEAKRYPVPMGDDLKLGLNILDDKTREFLRSKISENVEIKFTAPSGLYGNTMKSFLKNGHEKAVFAVSKIVETMNLNQIWGSGTAFKLNPVSNFAASLLAKNDNDLLSDALLGLLKHLNPIEAVLSLDVEKPSKEHTGVDRRPKGIDISFTEIIPENIYARQFIAGESTFYNIEAALNKTDIAEKLHQSMLRDISEYLKSIGMSAYESTSIDLMIDSNGKIKIFEIKSANIDNLIAQAAKGAFQIACYATEMKKDFDSVRTALIINKVMDENLEMFVLDSLKFLNMDCLIYNPDINWPHRIVGLLD